MEAWNYFNYFTEIEEYFWKKRGAHLLVSPLDWAIMETWQKAGVPLEAVLTGIDRAFESYGRSRRGAGKLLKSLAYCTDAVLEAAEEKLEAAAGSSPATGGTKTSPTFSRDEIKAYFARNVARLVTAGKAESARDAALGVKLTEIAMALMDCEVVLEAPAATDFEDLERRLTVLDEKLYAILITHATEEWALRIRREVDRQLAPYRRKMKAEQLALIERQYIQKRLLEQFDLPRLSLYYFS